MQAVMIKRFFYILVLIGFVNVAFCAKSKPDAFYHLIQKEYKLNADGSMDYHFRKELQLFSNDAFFNKYGETPIEYNTEFETLTINEAYTIRKDGSKVKTPANAFNPSLPSGCTNCERFNTIREMVVTHTALEYDATIVLDYTIHTTPTFLPALMEQINLYEDAPIERYDVSIELPASTDIQYNLNYYGKALNPTQTKKAESYLLQWSFTDLPQKPADAYLPQGYLPTLLLTTFAHPSSFMDNLTFQNAFTSRDHSYCKEQLTTILQNAQTGLEKVLAIRKYLADNIHTNSVSLKRMNYIIASPYTVWKTNCGTQLEKDLLFTTLLQEAGFRAEFGLLYANLMKNPESAVKVLIDNNVYFLSTGSQSPRSLDHEKQGDTFISRTGEISVFQKQPTNIEIAANISITGGKNNWEATTDVVKSVIQSNKNNNLKSSTSPKTKASIDNIGNGYATLKTSDGNYGCSLQAARIQRNRTLPIEVTPTNEHYTYTITLPQNAQCLTTPYRIEKKSEFGSMKIEMFQNGRTITIDRQLTLEKPFIDSKKGIKELREFLSEWNLERALIFQCK